MSPTKKKQKVAVKKEHEAETDDGEHDDQKQKVAVKKEYEVETDDEEEEDAKSSENDDIVSGGRDNDIVRRKKDLDTGKREKATYVWNLCTKHPSDYDYMCGDLDVEKRGLLIVLPKKRYELWHKILVNIENCQSWSDIRDLGHDVYEEVLNRCRYILSFDRDYQSKDGQKYVQEFSPKDSDKFDMTQVDVFGTYDNEPINDINMQDQSFPNFITKIMFDDLPDWIHRYNAFYSSFPCNSDLFQFDPKDVDSLLEDIILGGDSIEHQPGLEDFLEHHLKITAGM